MNNYYQGTGETVDPDTLAGFIKRVCEGRNFEGQMFKRREMKRKKKKMLEKDKRISTERGAEDRPGWWTAK